MTDRVTTPWGGQVHYRESTASTMDDAQALEDAGLPEGSLAWAGFQTSGRGRHPGRSWVGEPGASLLFTVYWDSRRFGDFAPSLVVGLGLSLWLEALGTTVPPLLKWPNDLYLAGRKIAGILVRRRLTTQGSGSVHAGIGINLRTPQDPSGFRTAAGSLADAGLELSPGQALESLLPALASALEHPDPRAACEERLWRLGETLELSGPEPGAEPRRGTVRGLDAQGRLVWDGPRGRESLSAGE